MSDTEVNPPLGRTGRPAETRSGRTGSDPDDAIDAALDKAAGRGPAEPRERDVPLKRQWDAGLEAELDAALAGFDPATFETRSPGSRPSDRAVVAARDRGQESQPGLRTGKVIGVRGKSVFIDLGGKSEGVLAVGLF